MREAYDCLVIGLGPAACVAAKTLASGGRRVAMIPSEQEEASPLDAWILPAAPPEAIALERCGLGPLSISRRARPQSFARVALDDGKGETALLEHALIGVTELRELCLAAATCEPRITVLAELQFARYAFCGERVAGVVVSTGVQTEPPSCEHALTAPVILDARAQRVRRLRGQETGRYDAHFWGVYHNVAAIADRKAWQYSSTGVEFWLLPLAERGETIVGVSARRQPATRVFSGADLWEEELVRCPELAERLIDAQLRDSEPEYCVYATCGTTVGCGVTVLEEIACPAAPCFRWSTLIAAAHTASTYLDHPLPRATLSAGEG
jgi:2-polyprenyl-6-methoxyphenol hydroxylase-like FAD-dependent oxidoreductase